MLHFIVSIFLFLNFPCFEKKITADNYMNKLINKYTQKMHEEGLCAAGTGGGLNLEKKINLMKVVFDSNSNVNVQQARKLIMKSSCEFLDIINSETDSKSYFEHFPATPSILRISIIFRKNNSNFQSLDNVMLLQGKIYYSVVEYNCNIMLDKLIHEETYEEAKAILAKEASQ